MSKADRAHIEETVEQGDPDRFVSAFFVPAERRGGLLALYAFDHEVARIGETVREPMAGHVRLAWWREQIADMYANADLQAPAARALAEGVRAYDLPRDLFEAYLDARALDLEEAPFQDEPAMEAHADAVAGGVIRLASRVLGAGHRADAAAGHAGRAVAYAGHMRDLRFFAQRRRCRLPVQWLEEAGLNAEDIFAASANPALRRVTERVAMKVRAALSALNRSRYPRAATPALAVATLARWPIARSFDPLTARPMPSWQRVGRLSLANLAWRF